MSTNLEIEYKTLLSMSEYEHLSKLFSHITPVRQTNYYFDSKNHFLREHKLALRIRVFKDAAEMTLKVPQEVGNIEHNLVLPLEVAKKIIENRSFLNCSIDLSEISDILESYQIELSEIICLGSLTTTRREYQISIGKAALDSNEYLGTSDYEFELEVPDDTQGKKDFADFLKKNHIEFRYARSKVVRFLDNLRYKNRN